GVADHARNPDTATTMAHCHMPCGHRRSGGIELPIGARHLRILCSADDAMVAAGALRLDLATSCLVRALVAPCLPFARLHGPRRTSRSPCCLDLRNVPRRNHGACILAATTVSPRSLGRAATHPHSASRATNS